MHTPFSIRAMRVLTWIQLVATVVMMLVILYAAYGAPEPGSAAAGFRDGFLTAMRYDPATFSAYKAGQLVGGQLFGLVLAILLLRFITRRNLTGIRVLCVAQLLVSIANSSVFVIPLLLVVLAVLRPTREYCEAIDEVVEVERL